MTYTRNKRIVNSYNALVTSLPIDALLLEETLTSTLPSYTAREEVSPTLYTLMTYLLEEDVEAARREIQVIHRVNSYVNNVLDGERRERVYKACETMPIGAGIEKELQKILLPRLGEYPTMIHDIAYVQPVTRYTSGTYYDDDEIPYLLNIINQTYAELKEYIPMMKTTDLMQNRPVELIQVLAKAVLDYYCTRYVKEEEEDDDGDGEVIPLIPLTGDYYSPLDWSDIADLISMSTGIPAGEVYLDASLRDGIWEQIEETILGNEDNIYVNMDEIKIIGD